VATDEITIKLTVGPFELMEARKLIESETAALAAILIDDEQLERLDQHSERNCRAPAAVSLQTFLRPFNSGAVSSGANLARYNRSY
jgi:DNA-binding FadR family transcriptional regulator